MNPASHTRALFSRLLTAGSCTLIALLAFVVPARGEAPGKPERVDPARGAEVREEKPELVVQSGHTENVRATIDKDEANDVPISS